MKTIRIACLGLNHSTAPVGLREQLACELDAIAPHIGPVANSQSDNESNIIELVLLRTCNRVELYACAEADINLSRALADLLAKATGVAPDAFASNTYYYEDRNAITHLCRVATGLDSLVIGEQQILGQVTDAHRLASAMGIAGTELAGVFRTAVRAGKRARTETAIGTNPANVSSVAISLARSIVGPLNDKNVLVVGLGEMGMLTLKALGNRGVENIAVVNRTRARADAIAASHGYGVYEFDELPRALSEMDVVISTTSAATPVITAESFAARHLSEDRPVVAVDIAVPRDIAPEVGELAGVHLFDTDSLRSTLDEGLAARKREIPNVYAIIQHEVDAYEASARDTLIKPLINDLRQKAEAIRQREIKRTLGHLGNVDADTMTHIERLSQSLVNKLLHDPTVRLKEAAGSGPSNEYATTIRDLFGLSTTRE